jgi:hypothetical protein
MSGKLTSQVKHLLCGLALTSVLGCQTIPRTLENKFENLSIKLQNGEEKKITDTAWYKTRKRSLDTRAYQLLLSISSVGGYYAFNTPGYCPGILGLGGTPFIATQENKELNRAFENKMMRNVSQRANKWLGEYSPGLVNVCNPYLLFESEITKDSTSYIHRLISLDDDAINKDDFNLFIVLEQQSEKILAILKVSVKDPALYTLKGEKLCEIDEGSRSLFDLSVEGLLKTIEGPEDLKTFPVMCFETRKAVLDIRGVKLSRVLGNPEGSVVLRFEDKSEYKGKLLTNLGDVDNLK